MKNISEKKHTKLSNNPTFLLVIGIYMAVLLLVSSIACYFSYNQRKDEAFSNMEFTYLQLEQSYTNTLDDFWQIYMPIWENKTEIQTIMSQYFAKTPAEDLSPLEKRELADALQQMMIRDNQVQWIALYSENRDSNYILFKTGTGLQKISEDFPYTEQMQSTSRNMEIYGAQSIRYSNFPLNTYVVSGGVPFKMGKGRLLAGYSLSSLTQIYQNSQKPLKSLSYLLSVKDQVIFASGENYQDKNLYLPQEGQHGITKTPSGESVYVHSMLCDSNSSLLSYQFSPSEFFFYCHKNTPIILLIVLLFAIASLFIYTLMMKHISKEVSIIRNGLVTIGNNQLTYQIPTNFKQSGLPEIAKSINQMATQLNENINRAYYYELKQKEAELSELQTKFNPHFLYNSLEMIRSRCFQNGDEKTAALITQLAGIFRGFIGSKAFIPFPEELAFSKRYLSLFGARYNDQVQIRYDIDTEVLQYGIIRNTFQPLIENYFVHGFDVSEGENNYICFHGKSLDKDTILLTIEDNGAGMCDEELERLNKRLSEPIKTSQESYGLKNLHQRLQLFYGEGYGLSISHNSGKGLSIQLKIKKITCEEYEASQTQIGKI